MPRSATRSATTSPRATSRARTRCTCRKLQDLADWLFAGDNFPDGVIISTGTGIVTELDFTLAPGDLVTIEIDHVGTLTNRVVAGKTELSWLAEGTARP